jgi:hypothetical protein
VCFFALPSPPAWINLIADAPWWVKGFGAYAALYVAELVKEAAKDTWKHKGKIVAGMVGVGNRVSRLASSLFTARSSSRRNTDLSIGLPIPDEDYTTLLRLSSDEPDDLALEIALFVHHLPALIQLLQAEGVRTGATVRWVSTELLDDGSLRARWLQNEPLQHREAILPLTLTRGTSNQMYEP